MRVCACTYVHICIHDYVCICVGVCVCARVCRKSEDSITHGSMAFIWFETGFLAVCSLACPHAPVPPCPRACVPTVLLPLSVTAGLRTTRCCLGAAGLRSVCLRVSWALGALQSGIVNGCAWSCLSSYTEGCGTLAKARHVLFGAHVTDCTLLVTRATLGNTGFSALLWSTSGTLLSSGSGRKPQALTTSSL